MTTIFKSNVFERDPEYQGTHVLLIGIGDYSHPSLEKLNSPPISVRALADWFLQRERTSSATRGFYNRDVPLATIELLVSPSTKYPSIEGHEISVNEATYQEIAECYDKWIKRIQKNSNNLGVFYFCGHGVGGAFDTLLAADFGGGNPWIKAFDIKGTLDATRREVRAPSILHPRCMPDMGHIPKHGDSASYRP